LKDVITYMVLTCATHDKANEVPSVPLSNAVGSIRTMVIKSGNTILTCTTVLHLRGPHKVAYFAVLMPFWYCGHVILQFLTKIKLMHISSVISHFKKNTHKCRR
jgi:hypothetical protein